MLSKLLSETLRTVHKLNCSSSSLITDSDIMIYWFLQYYFYSNEFIRFVLDITIVCIYRYIFSPQQYNETKSLLYIFLFKTAQDIVFLNTKLGYSNFVNSSSKTQNHKIMANRYIIQELINGNVQGLRAINGEGKKHKQ